MGADARPAIIICFTCRRSDCGCLPAREASEDPPTGARAKLAWAFAWLGGACVAGTAVGAALALLLGGG